MDDSVASHGSNSHPAPSGKVRHKAAVQPGAVSVLTAEPPSFEPSAELQVPLLDESSVSNASSSLPSEKMRRSTNATVPGAVSVNTAEPGTLDNLRNSVTRTSSMDTSATTSTGSNTKNHIPLPVGKMRHGGKAAVRPGATSVSAGGEEQEVPPKDTSTKAGLMGRRNNGAAKPGAVSMTNGKEEDRAQTKSNKFRLGPAPVVVTSDKDKQSEKTKKNGKVGKKLDAAVPELAPGAVSVKVAGEQTISDEEIGGENDLNKDPSLEVTLSADSGGTSNLLPIPTTLPKPSGRRRGKGSAPPKPVRDRPDTADQIVNVPVHGGPKKSHSLDATGIKTRKKGIFGFLKKSKK